MRKMLIAVNLLDNRAVIGVGCMRKALCDEEKEQTDLINEK